MIYPTLSKYSSAVSNPKTAFTKQDGTALDSELSLGKPVIYQTGMGAMPLYFPGGYACVFKYENNLQNKFWAVRCFLQANPSVASHYAKVSQRLKTIPCKQYFIDFQFQEEGIRIVDNNQIYPIVKMEWAEGDDLRTFITNNLGNKNKLSELADIWVTLSRDLKKAGIAHGDIQHGNILIEDASTLKLKLVDYDSLYFTSDGNAINNEIHGYPEYQHPLRSSLAKQCLQMDFFPQLVVYLSLKALIADSKIWQKYKLSNADRRLLFEPADFADPDNSKICQHLLTLSPEIQKLTREFINICKLTDFDQMPSLGEIVDKLSPPPPQVAPSTISQPNQLSTNSQNNQQTVKWNPQTTTNTSQPLTQNQPSSNSQQPLTWQPSDPSTQSPSQPNSQIPVSSNSQNITIPWLTPPNTISSANTSSSQLSNNQSVNTSTSINSSSNSKTIQEYIKSIQKWKIATASVIVISLGLGGFSIWQYVQIEQLKQNIENRGKNWLSLENLLRDEIANLKKDKSSLERQTSQLNTKISERLKEVTQLNKDKQDLIDSRSDRFEFNGRLTSSNSSSNPISHNFNVPKSSKVDVYLYGLTSDVDFDIANNSGQTIPNSTRNQSGIQTEVMDRFIMNISGSYSVRVWLNSGSDTAYSLRIYRYS